MRTVIFAIKFGMTAIGLLLIAAGALAVVCQQQFQALAARQISLEGTRFAGTPFSVERISVSLKDRGIVLHNIGFRNPDGFSEDLALQSDRVVLTPVWNTLFSQKPVFETAVIENPICRVEYKPDTGSNLGTLLKRLEGISESTGQSADRPAREFQFKKVACEPTRLQLNLKPLPSALTGASIPAFDLDELGTSGPMTGEEVLDLFLKTLAKKVLSVNGLLPV